MPDYHLVKADEALVKQFIDDLQEGVKSFRYFQSRPYSIINQHLITLLYVDAANYPLAYGHLDKENETLWLGVAVADKSIGKGLGKQMMQALIDWAREKKQPAITLSVDQNNIPAQRLYQKLGFEIINSTGKINLLKLQLN